MKNVTINTAASWSGSFRSFQDGDIFRESNVDLNAGDLADRLGYLKAQADNAVLLTGSQTITGNKTFNGTNTFGGPISSSNAITATNTVTLSGALNQSGVTTLTGQLNVHENLSSPHDSMSDANESFDNVHLLYRAPQITANRFYTLQTGASVVGRLTFFTRSRTADAFTCTIQDAGGTVGVIDASAAGWLLLQCVDSSTTGWRVVAWGGTVSSLRTTA